MVIGIGFNVFQGGLRLSFDIYIINKEVYMELPDSVAFTKMLHNNLSNFENSGAKSGSSELLTEDIKVELVNEITSATLESSREGEFPVFTYIYKSNPSNLRFLDLLGEVIDSNRATNPPRIYSTIMEVANQLNEILVPYELKLVVKRKGISISIEVTQRKTEESGDNKK